MKCMNVKACMACLCFDNVYVSCFIEFHARCIGIHMRLNEAAHMYTITAGLHMMISCV
jgi:hypothetical protein